MLSFIILLQKVLSVLVFISLVAATTEHKPDMQKVYDEAVNWSKTKLDKIPDTEASHATASIGVCRGASEGEPLIIKPPCSKKQKIDAVVDGVIDDAKANTSLVSTRNLHADILSTTKKTEPKILVFVSFSMPKASLRALASEAAKHNAVLVMRGLKGDSFKTTQKAFLEILTQGKNLDPKNMANQDMQGFEVNPELFKTYKIKKVPVFVLIKNTQEISRLSGNVSLDFAAKKLKENI
jgi:type-F conjugative transfer system pilin assembly protein TrbC